MSVMTLDGLRALASGDENEGPVEDRIAVVAARAELAQRGVSLHLGLAGLGERELAALAGEAADPVGAITSLVPRDPDEDDKDEEWGGNSVLTRLWAGATTRMTPPPATRSSGGAAMTGARNGPWTGRTSGRTG